MKLKINDRPLVETLVLQKIKSLREQLIQTGMHKGLNHEKTINISQKLDEYIYLYQSFEKNNNEFSTNN